MNDPSITTARAAIESLIPIITEKYAARCKKHGTQSFASSHEMLGVLTEEYYELLTAIHAGDRDAIRSEAMDLLQVALHWLVAEGRTV